MWGARILLLRDAVGAETRLVSRPPPRDPVSTGDGGDAENKQLPWSKIPAGQPLGEADRRRPRLGAGNVIDHVVQSTLFAIGAALLTLAFRGNRARLRSALWFSASVKFLLPYSLVAWLASLTASSSPALQGNADRPGVAGLLEAPRPADRLDGPPIGDADAACIEGIGMGPFASRRSQPGRMASQGGAT